MPTLYTASKVHNEIIFCVVYDQNKKAVIEKAFLKNRISYYETWEKVSFLMRLFGKKEGDSWLDYAVDVKADLSARNGFGISSPNYVLNITKAYNEHIKKTYEKLGLGTAGSNIIR